MGNTILLTTGELLILKVRMVKKQLTSKKVPIRKRKNFFMGAGMRIDFTKEDYGEFGKILKNYAKTNNWSLKKEKAENGGYSVFVSSKSNSAEEVLNFINNIKSLFEKFEKIWGDGRIFYPDDYTNIKYYDMGDPDNLFLGIHRFSDMMVINIYSKNAIELDKEDPEIAQEIFGDYMVDGNKLLNVRVVNDDRPVLIGANGWGIFWVKFIIFSIISGLYLGLFWGVIVGFVSVIIYNVLIATIKDLFGR